ncbi:hypothetical protein, conserved [Babesia ovata]|uniref:6-Cys domain-containing protein n=1 Tax=Babesia ovata TaxID=189622 RepID=A0A2H6KHX9_9APIC|nr:uncharacterized protein BOVATA_040910 [Babesia ovata]GBE62598.1 hypothetical protein, conserved [Babesia ovata]
MAEFRIMKCLFALSALALQSIVSLNALLCDFGDADGFNGSNALVTCRMDIAYSYLATVICPSRVHDTEYTWHPQPTSKEQSHITTYVSGNGKLRSVALSDVVRSESEKPLVWFESNMSERALKLDFLIADTYAITERRLMFICGPLDFNLGETLQRHLDRLNVAIQMQELPWTSSTPPINEIANLGKGIGVFLLYRGDTHLPIQGCGSRPSPLFHADSEVTVDPITGIRSCVADPMSQSRIGFVCEGRIEPEDCMRSLLYKDGSIMSVPAPYSYRNSYSTGPWVVAKYFNELALPPFSGECRCIDPETDHIKAKIEIRSKTDHVCDISSMMERGRASPISGPWCSVVLHPGSTLTIRFPVRGIYASSDRDLSDAVRYQKLPINEYETEFLPNDLSTLRQLASFYDFDIYDEIPYHDAISGDALEMDASQISQGEVKLIYHQGKPLTSLGGHNAFLYHWTLKSRNENVADTIRAIVNVSFAFTHIYHIVGCDRRTPGVFDRNTSRRYCSTKEMGNGIGDVYECAYNKMSNMLWAGIHCSPGEELLPANCDHAGYDLHSNQVMPFPESLRNATPHPMREFQVFRMGLENVPLSHACICVDKRGYETSRLILESSHRETYTYLVRRRKKLRRLISSISPPRNKAKLLIEGIASAKSTMIYHEPQKPITLNVGKTLVMSCSLDTELQTGKYNGMIESIWLPTQTEALYYDVKETPYGTRLVSKSYNNSIATSPDGFRVTYDNGTWTAYHELTIQSRRGAVIISKDPLHKKFVPMSFVCGMTPKQSDLCTIADDATELGSSADSIHQATRLSGKYTWNVVQVNVETTDPYMQGCGVTYATDELFKPETPKLYNAYGQLKFGCKIDIQAAGEAAFYCPAPYVLDPPNCFKQVLVNGLVKNISDLSYSLVASHSNHFVTLHSFSKLAGPGETLRPTPPLECRCVTTKGIILSTIQIENYYAK